MLDKSFSAMEVRLVPWSTIRIVKPVLAICHPSLPTLFCPSAPQTVLCDDQLGAGRASGSWVSGCERLSLLVTQLH